LVTRIEFETSKVVNEFCHLSVLYSDLMPAGVANGILRNIPYQQQNWSRRQDDIRLKIQKFRPFASDSDWYKFVTGLMKRDKTGAFLSLSNHDGFTDFFRDLRLRRATGFDEIWENLWPRLEAYEGEFLYRQWGPINDRVMLKLHELAKAHWQTDKIRVHYVECLCGGFAWNDCIGLTAFPDMEVEKKLLAHELSELITPQDIIDQRLREARLNPGITHTVVDMLAYFSIKDFVTKSDRSSREKKGIKPNPKCYPMADVLFPFFERYSDKPSIYADFGSLMDDLIAILKGKTESPIISS
jgi:hypothetical protein